MSVVPTKETSDEVALPAQQQGTVETKEASASANASAGVNLNLFGAVAGLFTSQSTKETAADGSSTEVREENLKAKGTGEGTLNAVAAGDAEEHSRQTQTTIK